MTHSRVGLDITSWAIEGKAARTQPTALRGPLPTDLITNPNLAAPHPHDMPHRRVIPHSP